MTPDLPLATLIEQIIIRTPVWVWGILAVLTVLGWRQTSVRLMPTRRLTILPVVLGVLSMAGAVSLFGLHATVLLAWAGGAAAALYASRWFGLPARARAVGDGRFEVQGSIGPLLAMWAIFCVRYASAVLVSMQPELAHDTAFGLTVPAIYGALCGLFVSRSLRILRTAARPAVAADGVNQA